MSRTIDRWLGLLLLACVVLAHALIPRYTIIPLGNKQGELLRIDRWTGRLSFMSLAIDTDWVELPMHASRPARTSEATQSCYTGD